MKKVVYPLAIAILIISVFYAFNIIAQRHNAARYSLALRACSSKIPNTSTSTDSKLGSAPKYFASESVLDQTQTTYTSYSRYPAFDRCLATKGFAN